MSCRCCGQQITVGPSPYYEKVSNEVIQNHESIIVKSCYPIGIRSADSWNVPAVDESISIKFLEIVDVVVGIYLFNPSYGYFKITGWNPETSTITIQNEDGFEDNVVPGTYVPESTLFVAVPKPCCEDDTSVFFPFLAQDFVAPNNGSSRTIQVTSTFGLIVNNYVRIGTGVYLLTAINSSNEVVIKNEGAGHTPASTVEALDGDGDYQYLLTSEAVSGCAGAVATSGKLVVCDAGVAKTLNGATLGHIPVLSNTTTDVFTLTTAGTASITDGAITAPKLASDSVTTAKILDANVTTAKLAPTSVTQAKLANDSVGTAQIIDLNVTTGKLAAKAVTNGKIGDGAVDNLQLADGAISENKLQFNSVSSAIIQTAAVITSRLADLAVTTAKLDDASVSTVKIIDESVTTAKIADLLNSTSFTPTFYGSPNIGIDAVAGRYWTFGPFVIAWFDLQVVATGTQVTSFDVVLPVAGKITDGSNIPWIGTVLATDNVNTDADLKGSTAFPIIHVSTGTDVLRVVFGPDVQATVGQQLYFQVMAIYPIR